MNALVLTLKTTPCKLRRSFYSYDTRERRDARRLCAVFELVERWRALSCARSVFCGLATCLDYINITTKGSRCSVGSFRCVNLLVRLCGILARFLFLLHKLIAFKSSFLRRGNPRLCYNSGEQQRCVRIFICDERRLSADEARRVYNHTLRLHIFNAANLFG